jgi:hypothetical protein
MIPENADVYARRMRAERAAWLRKPALRILRRRWHRAMIAQLGALRPVVELGAGCGAFKNSFPECVATDRREAEWIDRTMDPQNLQFVPGEVGNFVMIDGLCRLQRPISMLRQASVALKPGGRIVLCEPAVTPWAKFLARRARVTLDTHWDLFAEDGLALQPDPDGAFVNLAIPHLLFCEYLETTLKQIPNLKLVRLRKSGFALEPLVGGFSPRASVPAALLPSLLVLESFFNWPLASWLTGVRMLVVLEKPL